MRMLVALISLAWIFASQPLVVGGAEFDAEAFVRTLKAPQAKVELEDRPLAGPFSTAKLSYLSFSADTSRLAALYATGEFYIWEVATGKLVSRAGVKGSKVRAAIAPSTAVNLERMALSADHGRIATSHASGDVLIWDAKTSELVAKVEASLMDAYGSIAFNSNGKYLVLGGKKERGAVVVNADDGTKAFVHDASQADIIKVAVSADDKWAMFISKDNRTHHYPLLGGKGGTHEPVQIEKQALGFVGTNHGMFVLADENVVFWRAFGPGNRTMQIRASVPARMDRSPGDAYFMIYDVGGTIEVRDAAVNGICRHLQVQDKVQVAALGADAKSLALGTADGVKLRIAREPIVAQRVVLYRELKRLLAEGNYDTLEAIGKRLEKEVRPVPTDPKTSACDIFVDNLSEFPLDQIERWAKERDQSVLAKTVQASAYLNKAWDHRGSGTADTVTEEGWRRFHEYVGKAREVIEPVCQHVDAPPVALRTLLTVAMAESWEDKQWQPYATRLYRQTPNYLSGHVQVVTMLLPRWGGAQGASAAYAKRVADAVGGDDGDAFYAELTLSQWRMHNNQDLVAVLGLDYDRVKRGLKQLATKGANPHYGAHWGLRLTFTRMDKAGAKEFLPLIRDKEAWEPYWWPHYEIFHRAMNFAQSG